MMWRTALMGWLVLLVVASGAVAQRVAPEQRVRAAFQVESRIALSGVMRTTTYLQGNALTAEVTVYRREGNARYEYRSPQQVLIDRGDMLIRLDPNRRIATVETIHRTPVNSVDLLLKNYEAVLVRGETLLGRSCDVVKLQPKRGTGPSRLLWIDRATGVILRSEQYNSQGKLVSRSEFLSVDWKARPADSLFQIPAGWRVTAPAIQAEKHLDKEQVSRMVGIPVREPTYVPPGFVLDGYHVVQSPSAHLVAHLRYVDGLNSLSVFQHRCAPGRRRGFGFQWGRRLGRRDGCELFSSQEGNALVKEEGGIRLVVVGDLPQEELQKVMDSIR